MPPLRRKVQQQLSAGQQRARIAAAAVLFKALRHADCLKRRFFFDSTKREIFATFPNFFDAADDSSSDSEDESTARTAPVEDQEFENNFGWYVVLAQIAESGMFRKSGLTAIEAASTAPLYDAFFYLEYLAAQRKREKIKQGVKI